MNATPPTCRILWIRHGETAWNTEKRFQGHLDIPLNETGHQQAAKLAQRLQYMQAMCIANPEGANSPKSAASPKDTQRPAHPESALVNRIARLYASDLARAAQTAMHISESLDLPLATLPQLRERNYGELAGLTGDEMAARSPAIYEGLAKRHPDAAIPGGESLQQFYDRTITATMELVARHPGETLCVVVHGGVLDCIYRKANGIDLPAPRQWLLANASINIVEHASDQWNVLAWGDTDHLNMQSRDEVDGRIV